MSGEAEEIAERSHFDTTTAKSSHREGVTLNVTQIKVIILTDTPQDEEAV
jgi:hypothetical protein